MRYTGRLKAVLVFLLIFLLCDTASAGEVLKVAPGNLRIGVILCLTGPDALGSEKVLEWAAKNLNTKGGVGGRHIEIVFRDQFGANIIDVANEFLEDDTIDIVIGPQSSAKLSKIADLFRKKRKILLSPTSTAEEILRKYREYGTVWRTCQNDVYQIRTILSLLHSNHIKKISLVSENSIYGKTFHRWAGFFSYELGMDLLNIVEFPPGTDDFSKVMDEALTGDPEYLVAVAFSRDAVKIKKELDKRDSRAGLFLADAAETPYLIEKLGESAIGVEIVSPTSDPESGFEEAFREKFDHAAWDYAATTYDAFILSACALARQEFAGNMREQGKGLGEDIVLSFGKVVTGRGEKVPWNRPERAIELILLGKSPDIIGASGPLDYDVDWGVDPLHTFYAHRKIEKRDGVIDFRTQSRMDSSKSSGIGLLREGWSAGRTLASPRFLRIETAKPVPPVTVERKDLWAVIVASSGGWSNYRHQADALALYSLLKSNGVDDDHIVLFLIDDLPTLPENPIQGDVHHDVGGRNLREGAVVDYSGDLVNAENVKRVLLGERSVETPVVLESGPQSNVLFFHVDHGAQGILPFDNGEDLKSSDLAGIIQKMYGAGRYRQLLMMVEVCYGESIGRSIKTPNTLFLTGAAEDEVSYGATFDGKIQTWIADDFINIALKEMKMDSSMSIKDLYTKTYEQVTGSHVRLLNYKNFENIDNPISDFIIP